MTGPSAIYALRRHFGTVTDISELIKQPAAFIAAGPYVSPQAVDDIRKAIERRATISDRTHFHFDRDGKKILAFVAAYSQRWQDCWADEISRSTADTYRTMVNMIVRWIVTGGPEAAKEKAVEWLNYELSPADWGRAGYSDFIRRMVERETADLPDESKVEFARAFVDARDNLQSHITAILSGFIAEYGALWAKDWIRAHMRPHSEEYRVIINAAYVAANK